MVLALTTNAFMVPATALAGKGPCASDKLKFCWSQPLMLTPFASACLSTRMS